MNQVLTAAIQHWQYVAPVVKMPTKKQHYEKLVLYLDELLNIVGDDENHELMSLIDFISFLISEYEHNQLEAKTNTAIDALKCLMEENDLHQTDFPEIASQGVMSEILSGKRQLNVRQIKALSKRFNVDPATFIDER